MIFMVIERLSLVVLVRVLVASSQWDQAWAIFASRSKSPGQPSGGSAPDCHSSMCWPCGVMVNTHWSAAGRPADTHQS